VRAIEVNGVIDNERKLHVDGPLPVESSGRVRVIILLPEEADIDESSWERSAAANPAFEFLADPAEDIYTLTDGHAFTDQG
jgi:hypothetical protein